MADEKVEVFVHSQGAKPKAVDAAPTEVLREVLIRSGFIKEGDEDILVFVGECEEALAEDIDVEDGADEHAPVDVSLTLEVIKLKHHDHVHCHRCRHIAVEANFSGKTKRRKFSPASTIGVVTQWARRKFKLEPASAAEYVLQICDSTKQPRPDTHLGELVEAPNCSICFDLVKEITPQG